ELHALLLGAQLEQAEDPLLERRLVDPERAAAQLVAVSDQVIRDRRRLPWILVEAVLPLLRRTRERMVDRSPPTVLLRPLEHREVRDPDPGERVPIDQVERLAEMRPEGAEDPLDAGLPVRREQDGRARLTPERLELRLRQELRDRRAGDTLLVVDEVREPLRPPLLRERL